MPVPALTVARTANPFAISAVQEAVPYPAPPPPPLVPVPNQVHPAFGKASKLPLDFIAFLRRKLDGPEEAWSTCATAAEAWEREKVLRGIRTRASSMFRSGVTHEVKSEHCDGLNDGMSLEKKLL